MVTMLYIDLSETLLFRLLLNQAKGSGRGSGGIGDGQLRDPEDLPPDGQLRCQALPPQRGQCLQLGVGL